jgi:hypothetical protein
VAAQYLSIRLKARSAPLERWDQFENSIRLVPFQWLTKPLRGDWPPRVPRWNYHLLAWSTGYPGRRERDRCSSEGEGRLIMLYTIAVVLIVLWLLGLVSSYTMGGFIHVLLVIAIIVVLLNIIQGRRAL